jgi:hypothetical protein
VRLRRGLAALLLGVPALVTAGCASSPSDLTAQAEQQLRPRVEHLRVLIHAHEFTALVAAVHSLDQLVERLEREGQVTRARGTQIEDAADALLALASPSPSPSPSPTRSPTLPPTPSRTPSPTRSPTPTSTPTTPSPSPTSPSPTPSVTVSVL